MRARVGQVEYLGEQLRTGACRSSCRSAATASSSTPRRSCRTCRRTQFPAQTLAAALYVDSGVRAMERGIVSAGRDPETGENRHPKLELVRLTIPRRVYTQAHMDVIAESWPRLRGRERSAACRSSTSPKYLRFFQARFEPLA